MRLQICEGEWFKCVGTGADKISIVYLGNNQLSSIPIDLFKLPNVKEIYLHINKIKHLPSSQWECFKLQVLDVSHNQLRSLPKCIANFIKLEVLKFSDNRLEDTPIFMSKIKFADFSSNLLTSTTLKHLLVSNIEYLKLESNLITELPEEFLTCSCLHVNLSDNQISSIPYCKGASNSLISILNLSGNKLSIFPRELANAFPCLSDLNMSGNPLTEVDIDFLHNMALLGRRNVVLAMIEQFHLDIDNILYYGSNKQSLLHSACVGGNADLVKSIYKSSFVVDENGDTPLHCASASGHTQCVQFLLSRGAPILLRNSSGHTPMDVATHEVRDVLEQYMMSNEEKIYHDYDIIREMAAKTYSGRKRITRIFVIGNPGAGKSTLIETLKSESWLDYFKKVSEASVPRHTAGIIPSIYSSKFCGRALFYDFAGDPEYYSSHAAILENIASCRKGDNIFIIVVDLREKNLSIKNIINHWTVFIKNQKFTEKNSFFIIAGSHCDLLGRTQKREKQNEFKKFKFPHFMLNCRKPKSVTEIQNAITSHTKDSPCYKLTFQAHILLGLLQKDFANVVSCPLDSLISHIVTTHINLPTDSPDLKPILSELQDIGLLFMINSLDDPINDTILLLNIAKLTEEVHKQIFSKDSAKKYRFGDSSFNIGIIPQDLLFSTEERNLTLPAELSTSLALPNYVTKECLIQLQYCQEISRADFEAFLQSPIDASCTQQSFLFFPALCTAKKSDVPWNWSDVEHSISWLAKCADPIEYFPSRFLHVLLLRLVFRFTLSDPRSQSIEHSILKNRRCTMWTNGIRWLMSEGVECMVELVDTSKTVLVNIKGDKENYIPVFLKIINCIMITMEDFCHNVKCNTFFLGSINEDDFFNKDNMFAKSDLDDMLPYPDKKEVVSVSGEASSSKILSNYKEMKAHEFKDYITSLSSLAHSYLECQVDCNSDNDDLHEIAHHVPNLDSKLTPILHAHLKLTNADVSDIKRHQDPELQRYEALMRWKRSQKELATYRNLLKVFVDIEFKGCAEVLCKILNKKCVSSNPSRTSSGSIESFILSLPSDVHAYLEWVLDKTDLRDISCHMMNWDSTLATPLKLSDIDIDSIKRNHPLNSELQKREALKTWKNNQMNNATYGNLLKLFVDAGDMECAEALCSILRRKHEDDVSSKKHEDDISINHFDRYVASLPAAVHHYLECQIDSDNKVDKDIREIAHYMVNWELKLATHLKLTAENIADIKESYKEPELQRREALIRWKNIEMHHATYGNLLQVFVNSKHAECAEALCALLKKKHVFPFDVKP